MYQYHKIPGTNIAIPVMTLDEGVKNMSLNGRDPVVDAVKGGKPPTLRDVKRSVKVSGLPQVRDVVLMPGRAETFKSADSFHKQYGGAP